MIIKWAFKNLIRQKRRTLFIFTVSFLCFFIFAIALSFINGMKYQMIINLKYLQTGDIRIEHPTENSLSPMPSIEPILFEKSKIEKILKEIKNIEFTNRILMEAGFSFHGNYTQGWICAISPDKEKINKILKPQRGRFLLKSDKNCIYISSKIANELKINPKDYMTLLLTTEKGKINAKDFKVIGIYKANIPYFAGICYINLEDGLCLKETQKISYVLLFVKNEKLIDKITLFLKEKFKKEGIPLEIRSYKEAGSFVYSIILSCQFLFIVGVLILSLISAIGITSVMLIVIFERLKEIATLVVLGIKRRKIIQIFVSELFLIEIFAFIISLILAIVLVFIINNLKIKVKTMALTYMLGSDILFLKFDALSFIFIFLFIFLIKIIFLFYPLILALKKPPAEVFSNV